eukprot:1393248-Amorphochlora_amoeboformis.AAC.1
MPSASDTFCLMDIPQRVRRGIREKVTNCLTERAWGLESIKGRLGYGQSALQLPVRKYTTLISFQRLQLLPLSKPPKP